MCRMYGSGKGYLLVCNERADRDPHHITTQIRVSVRIQESIAIEAALLTYLQPASFQAQLQPSPEEPKLLVWVHKVA